MQLESSVARGQSGVGIYLYSDLLYPDAVVTLSNVTVMHNAIGIHNGTTMLTRENNRVSDNDADGDPNTDDNVSGFALKPLNQT